MSRSDRSRRVARYIKARRDELGLSQELLAERAGLNFKTVMTLEGGRHWPQSKTREKVEPVLGWVEGDIVRIADGGYPVTGPLPEDDPDGLISAAMEGDPGEFEARVRAVIGELPERYQPFVEELYLQLREAEEQNKRLRSKIVPLAKRPDGDGENGDEGVSSGPRVVPGGS